MSEAAYLALPEEKPGLEYWDGVVYQKTVGDLRHGRVQVLLAVLLGLYERDRGGWTMTEIRTQFLGRGFRLPDAAYWSAAKGLGDDPRFALPPTLAIEVRSPGESRAAQRRKCREMRAHGVDVCWLIDPVARTAERFEGDIDGEAVATDGVLQSPLLPGFAVPLAELWAGMERKR